MRYYILFCQHYYYLEWLRHLVEFCARGTVQIFNGTHFSTSLDTVIGTTTRLNDQWIRVQSQATATSFALLQRSEPALGATQALMGALLPWQQSRRSVKFTIHVPVLRLRMSGVVPLLLQHAFVASTGKKLKFYLYSIYYFLPIVQGQLFVQQDCLFVYMFL